MFDVKKAVSELEPELIGLRRDFHTHPELGYQEFNTSKKVCGYLTALGLEDIQTVTGTGITAILRGTAGEGKTLLLRADMDALPVEEKTGLPFASQNPGVMHACGHDGHTAIQLIVAKILSAHRDAFRGQIKFLFQPNEEEAGALNMINAGVLEAPHVDAALALHLWSPIKTGRIGLSEGPILGTTEEFELEIIGKAGHTATPHTGRDAILGACSVVQAMQCLGTREFDPLLPIAVMFGHIQGGTARNIVIDKITLEGTIRFLFPEEEDNIDVVKSAFERIVKSVCSMLGLGYQIEYIHSNSSLVNSKEIVDVLRRTARTTYDGRDNIVDFKSLMGEDFAEFGKLVPSAMTFFGVNSEAKHCIYPNYHPKYNIDEDVLPEAVEYFYRGIVELLRDLP